MTAQLDVIQQNINTPQSSTAITATKKRNGMAGSGQFYRFHLPETHDAQSAQCSAVRSSELLAYIVLSNTV
eukprot:scaffold32608_cov44-Prasinocladus_malaysianus.AAC.1